LDGVAVAAAARRELQHVDLPDRPLLACAEVHASAAPPPPSLTGPVSTVLHMVTRKRNARLATPRSAAISTICNGPRSSAANRAIPAPAWRRRFRVPAPVC